ncbi:MAG: ribulose-phosphate 3-epimerase, partial [Peptostreptococcaceae bacterium]|nr:ribulose-phosphate 3-epimerase [Peptostreptococcaceae bacterium]
QEIKALGVKAGVSINPATSLSTLDYILEEVDLVLIMSVNPGFGGQKFITSALEKVEALKEIREFHHLNFEIEIDGGITLENLEEVVSAGVDIVVAGSAVFGAENVEERTKAFVNLA